MARSLLLSQNFAKNNSSGNTRNATASNWWFCGQGVIYGPGGVHLSNRIGLTIGKWHLHFGGNNVLPLSYVDNCAEAIVVAGIHPRSAGQIYNVLDDDLPTCRQYLRAYKEHVTKIRSISVPYFGVRLLSSLVAKYNRYSNCQLPAILTPYKAASQWGGNRFDNSKLRSIGWNQLVQTKEGLQRTFTAFRSGLDAATMRKSIVSSVAMTPAQTPGEKLPPNSKEFVVGVALGPDSNGSFDTLLAAFSNLRKTGQPAKLVIFAPNDTQQIACKAVIQALPPDLQWVPYEWSTRDILQECDVMVSLQDGIPVLVLQAVSSGIPIITTAVRVPEALWHQRSVIFIRHGDQNALQAALLKSVGAAKTKDEAWFCFRRRISRTITATPICGARMARQSQAITRRMDTR